MRVVPGSPRKYVAPVRVEQAAETRRRILVAATELFAANGWSGTTLAAIAARAGVSPQAVHLSVGNKPAVLLAAVRFAVSGGEPSVALADREPFRRAFAPDTTRRERARAFAAGSRGVYQRAAGLFRALGQAAPTDSELAATWERARAERLSDCRRLVRAGGPDDTSRHRHLADLLFVLSGPNVHAELVLDRRWSGAQYEAWLAAATEDLLTP
jgi:AcrR family transcriptional regulator